MLTRREVAASLFAQVMAQGSVRVLGASEPWQMAERASNRLTRVRAALHAIGAARGTVRILAAEPDDARLEQMAIALTAAEDGLRAERDRFATSAADA